MKIASSEILLSAQHAEVQNHVRWEDLVAGISAAGQAWNPETLEDRVEISRPQERVQAAAKGPDLLEEFLAGRDLEELEVGEAGRTQSRTTPSNEALDELSAFAEKLMNAARPPELMVGTLPEEIEISPQDKAEIQLILAAIEGMIGKKIRLFTPEDLDLGSAPAPAPTLDPAAVPESAEEGERPLPEGGFGLHYRYYESHYEAETTHFEAEGVVQTRDGQEISVDVELTMSRQFASEKSLEIRAGAALQDPLVINFEGTAAELTQTRFQFDLDSDGLAEQINFVGPNSGFLALDKNENGVIDNGSELFGPTTGDGFAELAAHDADQNNFIDESDSIYHRLRIWSKDQEGNDRLMALGQRGIGAIYLGRAATPFSVKDQDNQLQGVVRSSGIYLNEDGSAGTVQQVDLVV